MTYKLALISPLYPFGGGMCQHVKELAIGFANSGYFDVTLFTNSGDKESAEKIRKQFPKNIKLKIIKCYKKTRFRVLSFLAGLFFQNFREYDLIRVHNTTYAISLNLLSKLKNKKYIVATHGWDANVRITKGLYRKLAKDVYKNAIGICSPSETERANILDLGVKKDNHYVIPVGVEYKKFNVKKNNEFREKLGIKNKYIVTFVGHVTWNKGVNEIIEAFDKLKNEDICFLLVGNFSKEGNFDLNEELNKAINKFVDFKGKFLYIGERPYEELPSILASTDIFLLPSYSEGMPLTLLEAMTAGCACIATNVGGIPQVLRNKENGLLIQPKSSEEIVNTIHYLIKNPGKILEFGSEAKETAKGYDWSIIVRKHIDFMLESLKKAK